MKVRNFASNMTVLELNNGDEVLFSYSTPVAAFISGRGYLKTEEKHSATTTRHINKWSDVYKGTEPQSFFDELVK